MQSEDESVARGALYHCISPSDQHSRDKLVKVRRYAEAQGWKVTEYVDEPNSADDMRRPGLDRLLIDDKRVHFDVLVVWSLARVARDLKRLGKTLDDLPPCDTWVDVNREINNPSGEAAFNEKNPRRVIGYWHGHEGRFTHPQALVDLNWEPDRRAQIVSYLRAGTPITEYLGFSYCRFRCTDKPNGKALQADDGWCWPEGLAHYVEYHGVRLPDEFVAHAAARHFEPPLEPVVEDPDDDQDFSFREDLRFWTTWCEQHAPYQFEERCVDCVPLSEDALEPLGEAEPHPVDILRVAFQFDTAADKAAPGPPCQKRSRILGAAYLDIHTRIARLLGSVLAGAVLQAARIHDDRIEKYLTAGNLTVGAGSVPRVLRTHCDAHLDPNTQSDGPRDLIDMAREVCQVAEGNGWNIGCWDKIYDELFRERTVTIAGPLRLEIRIDLPDGVAALAIPLVNVIIEQIWFGEASNRVDDAVQRILAAETGWTETWRERSAFLSGLAYAVMLLDPVIDHPEESSTWA